MITMKSISAKMQKLFACFLLLLVAHGCETIVDVDLPEQQPLLVANGIFSPDSVLRVWLYKSKSILESGDYEPVDNAVVEIVDEAERVQSLRSGGQGLYISSQSIGSAGVGRRFTLKASAPGLPAIEASDHIPYPVPIDSLQIDSTRFPWRITVNFTDPDEENYYQLILIEKIIYEGRTYLVPRYFESDDLIFQTLDFVDPNEAVFDDAFIAGKSYGVKVRLSPFRSSASLYVMLLSVSESYYKYIKSSQSQDQNGDNPFATPVHVHSNIQNGLGIFAAYSTSTVVIPFSGPANFRNIR